jgi:hypothetical protein
MGIKKIVNFFTEMLKVALNKDFAVAERFLCDVPIEYFIYVYI